VPVYLPASWAAVGADGQQWGLYLLVCVPVMVGVVATVAWEGSLGVTVFG
jgi:hypothetical protein